MSIALVAIGVAAAAFGFAVAPLATKAIEDTPPDPEDALVLVRHLVQFALAGLSAVAAELRKESH